MRGLRLRFSMLEQWSVRCHDGTGPALPLPMRTLAGAARTLLHEITGIGPSHQRGGTALNSLVLRGPYLAVDISHCEHWQRLYPWPAHLPTPGGISAQDVWLGEAEFLRWLAAPGDTPQHPLRAEGWLYQREHLRQAHFLHLARNLAFELEVWPASPRHDAASAVLAQVGAQLGGHGGTVRLGARGPLVRVQVLPPCASLALPVSGKRILLMFVTHADFAGQTQPGHFKINPSGHWQGYADAAHGVELVILQSHTYPNLQEAGWDSHQQHPRPARTLLPSGSVWCCQVLRGNPAHLQSAQLGKAQELGRGEIILADWA